jgi:linoleoyl-CoA desaturase
MQPLKFAGSSSPFFTELKEQVNQYFKTTNKRSTGNLYLYFKAVLLISVFLACYVTLVFFTPVWYISLPLCLLIAVATAGIGFNVMHDGGHGSFSSKKLVNRMAALTLNALGASSFFWNIKHNVVHHTYTNVEGHDDDIKTEPFIRVAPWQKRYFYHRFQHWYFVFAYGILYLAWVFILDFKKYFSKSVGMKNNISLEPGTHVGFWISKVLYIAAFVAIPIWQVGLVPFLIGYTFYMFVTGVLISIVFQLAHCVEEMAFVGKENDLENDWASHQLYTTANFATNSKIVSFFTGGLNFQVEHHLFPKISHVHYPAINKILKRVTAKYQMPYFEQPTFMSAVVSHIKFLKEAGRAN